MFGHRMSEQLRSEEVQKKPRRRRRRRRRKREGVREGDTSLFNCAVLGLTLTTFLIGHRPCFCPETRAANGYRESDAHFAAKSFTGQSVNGYAANDFTKHSGTHVRDIDLENEYGETKTDFTILHFDCHITDGRAGHSRQGQPPRRQGARRLQRGRPRLRAHVPDGLRAARQQRRGAHHPSHRPARHRRPEDYLGHEVEVGGLPRPVRAEPGHLKPDAQDLHHDLPLPLPRRQHRAARSGLHPSIGDICFPTEYVRLFDDPSYGIRGTRRIWSILIDGYEASGTYVTIAINTFYSNQETPHRELISNASDVPDKTWYESITDPEKIEAQLDFYIKIILDMTNSTITIEGPSTGMTKNELIRRDSAKRFLRRGAVVSLQTQRRYIAFEHPPPQQLGGSRAISDCDVQNESTLQLENGRAHSSCTVRHHKERQRLYRSHAGDCMRGSSMESAGFEAATVQRVYRGGTACRGKHCGPLRVRGVAPGVAREPEPNLRPGLVHLGLAGNTSCWRGAWNGALRLPCRAPGGRQGSKYIGSHPELLSMNSSSSRHTVASAGFKVTAPFP